MPLTDKQLDTYQQMLLAGISIPAEEHVTVIDQAREANRLRAENKLLEERLVSRDEALTFYEGVVCFTSMRALPGGALVRDFSTEKIKNVLIERDKLRMAIDRYHVREHDVVNSYETCDRSPCKELRK